VSDKLGFCPQLTRLVVREDFIGFGSVFNVNRTSNMAGARYLINHRTAGTK
jgi:hypothetical protein